MPLPAILTAAVAVLATGDAGPNYGPEGGQTVQTVVLPPQSRWKVLQQFEDGKLLQRGSQSALLFLERNSSPPFLSYGAFFIIPSHEKTRCMGSIYQIRPAAGPPIFDLDGCPGICAMDGQRLKIRIRADESMPIPRDFDTTSGDGTVLLILERENR